MPKKSELKIEACLAEGLTLNMLPPRLPIARRAPRRIVTRGGARVRGQIVDDRFAQVQWESDLEHGLVQMLRMCARATKIFSQPLVLDLEDRQYTPDCLVFLGSGQRLWLECKSRRDLALADVQQELAQANALLASFGETFRVLDETMVGTDLAAADNAQLLSLWRDSRPDRIPTLDAPMRYVDLCALYGAETVLSAMAHRWYSFDWSRPIGATTVLQWDPTRRGLEPEFLQLDGTCCVAGEVRQEVWR